MNHLLIIGGRLGAVVVWILAAMTGCTTFGAKDEDAKMAALQREVRHIERSATVNQKAMEDIYDRINIIEGQLEQIKKASEGLEKQLHSMVPTPDQPSPQAAVNTAASSEQQKIPTKTEVIQKPTTKKPAVEKRAAASLKPTAKQQYDRAYSAYTQKRYDESLALFKEFLERHSKHDLADNAQYWIGEIYYDIRDYPNAILAFKDVVTKFADRDKAPDALLKIGYAYIAMDDPDNARIFLKRVIKNYPFSTAEPMARTKLKEIENL